MQDNSQAYKQQDSRFRSIKLRLYSMLDRIPIFGKYFAGLRKKIRHFWEEQQLGSTPVGVVFTKIYKKNRWGDHESFSGSGSSFSQTHNIRGMLPTVIKNYKIGSILDIPCGDFNWMQNVDLTGVQYIGADIVDELINNNRQYENANIHFYCMDLMNDSLPKVDLVFVRDCLVHFSFIDVQRTLHNIVHSDSKYLLTTTFPEHSRNVDILTGQWRPINLQLPPFNFPEPALLVHEGNPKPEYQDKSMGLWKIDEIKATING